MVKCPFQRISDLQLGDKKVTLNHLVDDIVYALEMKVGKYQFSKQLCGLVFKYTPKTNMEPENEPWKRRFLLNTIIFRFHVSFRGGT